VVRRLPFQTILPSTTAIAMTNPAQPFDSRRSTIYNRQPEELHIPAGNSTSGGHPRQPMSHEYPTSPDTHLPSINIHSSSSQSNQYGGASGGVTGGTLPGSLQPGNSANRPPTVSMNTAPSTIPTLPHLSTQIQQQPQPQPQSTTPRSNAANSHGHSRSSPAGYRPHGSSPNAAFQPGR
jgi:WD repeat-containing protein 68